MKKILLSMFVIGLLSAGCGKLRFEPSQQQKQNAWLHHNTTEAVARLAEAEMTSDELQQLSNLSNRQSGAFVSYYGLPGKLPPTESVDDLLSEASKGITEAAISDAGERPDGWELADSAMELAIAVAGLLGGIYGTRAVKYLKIAREKSKALKEIIDGNELFKSRNRQYAEAFKQAHGNQSRQTKKVVAEMKG